MNMNMMIAGLDLELFALERGTLKENPQISPYLSKGKSFSLFRGTLSKGGFIRLSFEYILGYKSLFDSFSTGHFFFPHSGAGRVRGVRRVCRRGVRVSARGRGLVRGLCTRGGQRPREAAP